LCVHTDKNNTTVLPKGGTDGYPLCIACEKGHTEVVRLLLKFGANKNITGGYPLHVACVKRHMEIIDLLSGESSTNSSNKHE
jgi:ankyrin repeat protein